MSETQESRAPQTSLVVSGDDLFARTLRTVAILVAVCVVFVGALSAAAVAIASKAVGPEVPVEATGAPLDPASRPHSDPAPSRPRAEGTSI